MRLSERLQHWVARVELLARGGEPLRREALDALERGRPWEARALALRLLDEVADSPLALAVWADAAEAMLLEDEARDALGRLARLAPYRADVWLRLAQSEGRAGADPRLAYEKAVLAGEPREAAVAAMAPLLERALDGRDLTRGLTLAVRVRGEGQLPRVLHLRLAELALALGDAPRALAQLEGIAPELSDARGWVTWGRLCLFEQRDAARARVAFTRALILGDKSVHRHVGELLRDVAARHVLVDLLPLVKDLELGDSPEWQVAIALAQGHPERVLPHVERRAQSELTLPAWQIWLDLALAARNPESLQRAVASRPDAGLSVSLQLRLADAERLLGALEFVDADRLRELDRVGPAGVTWARELRQRVYSEWLESGSPRGWHLLFDELEQLATAKLNLEALNQAAELRADLEQPLRVAVIGEFNAGKSSLINALLGQAVAPVGVLPTTATINRLRWAPDRFVRVDFEELGRVPRVLEFGALKDFLAHEPALGISSVSIFCPLEALRQVEVIDTPGFNAGQPAHHATALRAARRAHVLLWLLDASAPLKASDADQLVALREVQVPTLVVVNKSDRVSPGEIAEIMQHVQTGLADLGIRTLTPPLAFSAKLAAEVDATAQALSGLGALKALFDGLLERGVELKGRVLVERARKIVADLSAGATDPSPLEAAALRAASRLSRGREAFEAEWSVALAVGLEALNRELVGVIGGDADLRGYTAERSASVLGQLFFDLVSKSVSDPELVHAVAPRLLQPLEALARGISLSLRPLGAGPAIEASAVARLLQLESVRFLRDAAFRDGENGGGPGGSSATAAAQRERLAALELVLGVRQGPRPP